MKTKKDSQPAALSKLDLQAASSPANGHDLISTMAGFVDAKDFAAPKGTLVKSMSPMIKPEDFPVGRVLVGKFTKLFETNPTPKKKGEGIEIVPDGSPLGIALPAVATLRQGLEISGVGATATSPHLGATVAIQRFPEKLKSKKGQPGWHFVVAIYPRK